MFKSTTHYPIFGYMEKKKRRNKITFKKKKEKLTQIRKLAIIQ